MDVYWLSWDWIEDLRIIVIGGENPGGELMEILRGFVKVWGFLGILRVLREFEKFLDFEGFMV